MVWQAIGAIATIGSGLLNYQNQKKQYKEGKQYQYDLFHKYTLPGYEMDNKKLIADHKQLVDGIKLQMENEKALAAFKDK